MNERYERAQSMGSPERCSFDDGNTSTLLWFDRQRKLWRYACDDHGDRTETAYVIHLKHLQTTDHVYRWVHQLSEKTWFPETLREFMIAVSKRFDPHPLPS